MKNVNRQGQLWLVLEERLCAICGYLSLPAAQRAASLSILTHGCIAPCRVVTPVQRGGISKMSYLQKKTLPFQFSTTLRGETGDVASMPSLQTSLTLNTDADADSHICLTT